MKTTKPGLAYWATIFSSAIILLELGLLVMDMFTMHDYKEKIATLQVANDHYKAGGMTGFRLEPNNRNGEDAVPGHNTNITILWDNEDMGEVIFKPFPGICLYLEGEDDSWRSPNYEYFVWDPLEHAAHSTFKLSEAFDFYKKVLDYRKGCDGDDEKIMQEQDVAIQGLCKVLTKKVLHKHKKAAPLLTCGNCGVAVPIKTFKELQLNYGVSRTAGDE